MADEPVATAATDLLRECPNSGDRRHRWEAMGHKCGVPFVGCPFCGWLTAEHNVVEAEGA